ncbi:MAG: thioredoxin family protein [Anaerolineae bacterium]
MTKRKRKSRSDGASRARWQIGVVVGILILIVVVLALKRAGFSATAPAESTERVPPISNADATSRSVDNPLAPAPDELPEAHLERLLAGGYPVFVFFHSTTCYRCIEMTKIVDEVYPDFESQVALVDVNVYDERNRALLQRAGIRVIPTLVFFDRDGTGEGATGVMPAEQLRAALVDLSSGDTP